MQLSRPLICPSEFPPPGQSFEHLPLLLAWLQSSAATGLMTSKTTFTIKGAQICSPTLSNPQLSGCVDGEPISISPAAPRHLSTGQWSCSQPEYCTSDYLPPSHACTCAGRTRCASVLAQSVTSNQPHPSWLQIIQCLCHLGN